MDHIKKAIQKAKASQAKGMRRPLATSLQPGIEPLQERDSGMRFPVVELDPVHLELNRIVSHESGNPFAIGFDVLRTRVLQIMRSRGWQTLMVTSPTMGCGKTVTAINLAISMARQQSCFAVLADCDFRKPHVAQYLGFKPERDLYDVITGEATLADAMRGISVVESGFGVLATRSVVPRPSEVLSSPEMKSVVAAIRGLSPETIAIFDLPPLLVADDVLAFMPEIDGVLLVAAAGQSTHSEFQHCLHSIPEEKLIGPVLTKSEESTEQYYQYY
jgi:protein-tyrosine kinase